MSKYPVPVSPKRIVSSFPSALHLSASSIAARIAWLDSGAGSMPSVRANCCAAANTSVCFTLTASMSFWS